MPRQTDPLDLATAAAVSESDELRNRARSIASQALDRAEYTLRVGTATEQAALMKHVIPTIMKSIEDENHDAKQAAQYAAYQRMRAWARGDKPEPAPAKKTAAKKRARKKMAAKKTAAKK